jgi:outer membrane receptor protein involved in Fe transport
MSHRHSVIYVALLIGFIPRLTLLAQPAPDTIHLPEVKIFHQESFVKQVYSYSELDSVTLNQPLNNSLSDILSRHSTIYVKSTGRGTLSTVSFRGTDASHTRICWNGLTINSPMLGQTDLSLIPALFLDNVSLYHGGSSLINSPGGIGGVIALDNKPLWNDKNSFSIISEIASFGTYETFGRLELKKNKFILKSRAFYNYSDNDYQFYNRSVIPSKKQRLQNSQYSMYGYLQELYFRTKKDDVFSAKIWLQHADRNIPQPISREGSEIKENQSDVNIRSVFNWKHYGKKGELEITSGIISDKIIYTIAQPSDGNITLDSRSSENGFLNRADYSVKLNPKTGLSTQIIYNYYNASISEEISSEGYRAIRSELSVMTEINREFRNRFSTYFLLRSELINRDFIPLMPSTGLSMKILNNQELYLKTNLSRNYNAPGLNDLYWVPGGNPRLKPEESYTADIALDFNRLTDFFIFKSNITVYLSRINDWIIWSPTEYQYWAPENVAHVFSRGLEFRFKTITEINTVKIIFQGNYNLCKTTNSDNRQLIYIPVHNINSWGGLIFKGYQLNYQVSYISRRYTQTDSEESNSEITLEPYMITNISMGKELTMHKCRLNFNFSVENLFNKDYQVVLARPMPGRNYSLLLGISF